MLMGYAKSGDPMSSSSTRTRTRLPRATRPPVGVKVEGRPEIASALSGDTASGEQDISAAGGAVRTSPSRCSVARRRSAPSGSPTRERAGPTGQRSCPRPGNRGGPDSLAAMVSRSSSQQRSPDRFVGCKRPPRSSPAAISRLVPRLTRAHRSCALGRDQHDVRSPHEPHRGAALLRR